jgi:hypothetical protein
MKMKKMTVFLLTFVVFLNANCQNEREFLNKFPVLKNTDTIMSFEQLMKMFYNSENEKNILDTVLALHYFFDNNVNEMHDIEEGYNADENTYIYTPYTKRVCPLFKKKINENLYLLCYSIKYIIYLTIYDYVNDKFESTFTLIVDSDGGDVFTWSTIFYNNYIVTIQSIEKKYYILSRIDYESRKFIELKKIKAENYHSYDELKMNAFETLGISITGELLEDNP